ncbi:MAG: hypothetical protein CMP20_01705 [Rickettsiales bacterium]|nr:hypothetical protein [Rickettsiales bacterium]
MIIHIIVLVTFAAVGFMLYALQQDQEQKVTVFDAFYVVFALLIGMMAGLNLSKFILYKSLEHAPTSNQK